MIVYFKFTTGETAFELRYYINNDNSKVTRDQNDELCSCRKVNDQTVPVANKGGNFTHA